jgi:GT2 family glycosyltransferase
VSGLGAAAGGPTADALDTAVVIVNYRTKALTSEAVASALAEAEVKEIVVVDNASGDDSAEYLRSAHDDPRLRVLQSEWNRGFGPAVNLGAGACHSPLLFILNSDATLVPGSLGTLALALVQDQNIGVIAPAVYESDGRSLQPATYGRLPTRRDIFLGNAWARPSARHDRDAARPGWVSGVAMLLRREDFLAIGGFDEGFSMYFEDIDLCRRIRAAGKSVRREPSAGVVHRGGKSWQSKRDQKRRFHESKLRYFQKLDANVLELALLRLMGIIRTKTAH